jgi:hypothetical protein
MSAPTFLQTLAAEVAKFQTLHPEREGDLARAHALILHGMVLPSADDPATGQVLSSDGEKRYTVNGTCDCQAGAYGKGCKHLHAWKLYRYIAGKVSAPEPPTVPLPEAPASVNVRLQVGGREVQWTLRDHDEARLAVRLETLLARYPVPQPTPQAASQGEGYCHRHQCAMQENVKEGRRWFSHRTADGQWCKGR